MFFLLFVLSLSMSRNENSPSKHSVVIVEFCIGLVVYCNVCLLKEIEEDRQLAVRLGATTTIEIMRGVSDSTKDLIDTRSFVC